MALLPVIDKVYLPPNPGNPWADDLDGEPILAPDFFDTNQVFKDSLVEFQDDLVQGRYEPSYIAEAAAARKARLEGVADKYKDGQYELFWGQRQRNGMIAGAAASIKFPELVQKGLLKVGDMWAFKRGFQSGILMEKEVRVSCLDCSPIFCYRGTILTEISIQVAEVTVIEGKYSLVFHIPPGDHKYSHPSREDIVLEGVVSPQTLETAIIRMHSECPRNIPNGNAYKVFNIWRGGEDLGLLWEIRQTYWGGE